MRRIDSVKGLSKLGDGEELKTVEELTNRREKNTSTAENARTAKTVERLNVPEGVEIG